MFKKILKVFIVWRSLLFLPLIVGFLYLPYRAGFEFTNIFSRITPFFPVNHFLLYPWANFDGVHYLSIAGYGYITEGVFFPLFPLLIRAISSIFRNADAFGVEHFFTGLFLANGLFLISLYIFYNLLRLDYSKNLSFSVIVLMLFFPTAFFFGSVYSESLFLALILSTLYFSRKKKWGWASLLGMLTTITRPTGILIIIPIMYEYLISEKIVQKFQKQSLLTFVTEVKNAIVFLLVPTGLVAYVKFNQLKWGDPLYFIKAHGNLANSRSVNSIILFPQTIFRYLKILFSVPLIQLEWWIASLELGMFFVASCLLYVAWKKKVRLSYLLFSITAFLVPVSSGTFSGLPRYTIVLFPIYIALANILDSRKKRLIYFVIGGTLLFLLLMYFSRGYYIS